MNWKQTITDLIVKGMTLQQIADECGFSSRGHVHDIKNGRQTKVSYDSGVKLAALHKKIMRKKTKR